MRLLPLLHWLFLKPRDGETKGWRQSVFFFGHRPVNKSSTNSSDIGRPWPLVATSVPMKEYSNAPTPRCKVVVPINLHPGCSARTCWSYFQDLDLITWYSPEVAFDRSFWDDSYISKIIHHYIHYHVECCGSCIPHVWGLKWSWWRHHTCNFLLCSQRIGFRPHFFVSNPNMLPGDVKPWNSLQYSYWSKQKNNWWFQPLWKILVSWDNEIPPISGKIKHIPNHQLVILVKAGKNHGFFHPRASSQASPPSCSQSQAAGEML